MPKFENIPQGVQKQKTKKKKKRKYIANGTTPVYRNEGIVLRNSWRLKRETYNLFTDEMKPAFRCLSPRHSTIVVGEKWLTVPNFHKHVMYRGETIEKAYLEFLALIFGDFLWFRIQ